MPDGLQVLDSAIAAARANDMDTLRGLIDWPLSGAPAVGRGMSGVLERDRARVVASGLAELAAAATSPQIAYETLHEIGPRLAGAREVRRAAAEVAEPVLASLQVPEPPPGLTDEQRASLSELRRRAAALREVYHVVTADGTLPVAWAPDSGRLVLVLD